MFKPNATLPLITQPPFIKMSSRLRQAQLHAIPIKKRQKLFFNTSVYPFLFFIVPILFYFIVLLR